MASALVSAIRGSGKNVDGGASFIITCYYYGTDVPATIEGHAYEQGVALPVGYTLSTLKSAIITAAQGGATALGLTVATSDVDLLGFDNENAQ